MNSSWFLGTFGQELNHIPWTIHKSKPAYKTSVRCKVTCPKRRIIIILGSCRVMWESSGSNEVIMGSSGVKLCDEGFSGVIWKSIGVLCCHIWQHLTTTYQFYFLLRLKLHHCIVNTKCEQKSPEAIVTQRLVWNWGVSKRERGL